MKLRSLLLTAALLTAPACGQGDGAESFRAGLPSQALVTVKTPASAGQGLQGTPGTSRQGLEGETSGTYQLTRGATTVVNGATVFVLQTLGRVVRHAPTELLEDSAVWGPHSEPLARNVWKLTVTRVAEGEHTYVLEARPKADASAAFVTVLSGRHVNARGAGGELLRDFGSGTFLVDWDQASTLPEHDGNVGSAAFTYARPDASSAVQVDVDFEDVKDGDTGQRVDANYRFVATPGQGGRFDFTLHKNMVIGAANEQLSIRSRWHEDGAGRSDVRLEGGDLGTPATLNECWDVGFLSTFLANSFAPEDPAWSWGEEAACPFASAEYAAL